MRHQLDDVIRSPGNNQHEINNGYKFTIKDKSSFYDWYNAYFEAQCQLKKIADGDGYATTDRITVINGAHSLMKNLMIKSAGKFVYDTDNLHNDTFVKNLLEYSDDNSGPVAKNSLWYLDTDNTSTGFEERKLLTKAAEDDALNAGGKDVNVIIPLNRCSFFEELEDKMLVPVKLQFNVELNNNGELIHQANSADIDRVDVNRFLLWIPKLTSKDSMYDRFVSSFPKESQWTYVRVMYEVSAPTTASGFFQISASIGMSNIFSFTSKKLQKCKWEQTC